MKQRAELRCQYHIDEDETDNQGKGQAGKGRLGLGLLAGELPDHPGGRESEFNAV